MTMREVGQGGSPPGPLPPDKFLLHSEPVTPTPEIFDTPHKVSYSNPPLPRRVQIPRVCVSSPYPAAGENTLPRQVQILRVCGFNCGPAAKRNAPPRIPHGVLACLLATVHFVSQKLRRNRRHISRLKLEFYMPVFF